MKNIIDKAGPVRFARVQSLLCVGLSMLIFASVRADENQPKEAANLGDLSLEELMNFKVDLVYGASRYEQRVTRAPASITIVTSDEIRKQGYRTLAEALRSVRGLYVSNDRSYSYLGIRGFLRPNDYNTRVLVMIDGHRINDNLFDSGTVAREGMVDISLVDRVEIIRGPSSSIYGSSAFFGVINVITRHGAEVDGGELSADAGSFNTRASALTLGNRRDNGFEWLASASHYESDGVARLYIPEFDQRISSNPEASNDGVAAGIDGERAFNLYTRMSYGDFGLTGFFSERVKQVPTASFGTIFNDRREQTTDDRGYLDIQYDHSFSANLSIQGRAFYDNYTYYGKYPYSVVDDSGSSQEVLSRDGTVGEWIGTQWQLQARLSNRHTLIVGGEYRDNIREYQFSYYDVDPRSYLLQDDRSSHTLGVFAQDEVELLPNLQLTGGLRFDYYFDGFGGTTNPRLGLIYNPTDTTTFKALFGDAYRAPNPYESFYNTEQQSRPGLRPERIRTFELVAEQYIGAHYRLTASAYYYRIHDLISQAATAAGDPYFDNLESANALGLELEAEAKFESGLLARLSYTFQRTEDGRTDRALTSSPQHLGKLGLIVPLFQGKLFTSLDMQFNGESATLSGGNAQQFVTSNLTLFSPKVLKHLALSFGVYNLFDQRVGYPGAEDHAQDVIQQDGRTVLGSATYSF